MGGKRSDLGAQELSRTLCDETTNQYHPAVNVLSVFV